MTALYEDDDMIVVSYHDWLEEYKGEYEKNGKKIYAHNGTNLQEAVRIFKSDIIKNK